MKTMIKQISVLLSILALIVVSTSCGYTTGIVHKDSQSYVRFSGNFKGATAYIDDLAPVILGKKSSATHSDKMGKKQFSAHYEINPGKHIIVVKRDGQVIVERELLLGKDMTQEIRVP